MVVHVAPAGEGHASSGLRRKQQFVIINDIHSKPRVAIMPNMSLLVAPKIVLSLCKMSSSNGNISRVTGHLCGEFTCPRGIPRTKASDAELWYFFFDLRRNKRLSKQSWGWWFETLSRPLWRHCNWQSTARHVMTGLAGSEKVVLTMRQKNYLPGMLTRCDNIMRANKQWTV